MWEQLDTTNTHTEYITVLCQCLKLLRLSENPPVCWSKVAFAAWAWPAHSRDKSAASSPAWWSSSVFAASRGQEINTT